MVSQWPRIRVMLQVRKVHCRPSYRDTELPAFQDFPSPPWFLCPRFHLIKTLWKHANLMNVVPSFFSDVPSQGLDKHQLHVTTVMKRSNQIRIIKFEPQ